MMGLIQWTPPAGGKRLRRPALEEKRILRMPFAEADILRGPRTPEAVLRRRVSAAARRLRRAGVTRAVLPEDFPWREQLLRGGVEPVSTVPLRQALAAELARAAAAALGISGSGALLAAAGDRPTGELVRAVTELALTSRYVLLDLPYGAEALAAQLRREYGVSLLLAPAGERQIQVLLLFSPRPELEGKSGTVVRLYDEEAPLPPLLLPPALEEQLPAGCSRVQLLAALAEGGALRAGQITVGCCAP